MVDVRNRIPDYDEEVIDVFDEDFLSDDDIEIDCVNVNGRTVKYRNFLNRSVLKVIELEVGDFVIECYPITACANYLGISIAIFGNVVRQYFPQVVMNIKGTTLVDKESMDYLFKYMKAYMASFLDIVDYQPRAKHYYQMIKPIALSIIYDKEFSELVLSLPTDEERGFNNYEVYDSFQKDKKGVKTYLFKGFATFDSEKIYDANQLLVACMVSRKRFERRLQRLNPVLEDGRVYFKGDDLNKVFRYSDFNWSKVEISYVSLEDLKDNPKYATIKKAVNEGVIKPTAQGYLHEADVLLLLLDSFNYDVRSDYGKL